MAGIKDKILSAAIRRFAGSGFPGTSLADVAGDVGVSKQAVLYHYPSREALRDAVLDRLLALANERFFELMSTLTGDGRDRVQQAVRQVGALFEAEPDAAAVILRFLLDRDAEILDRIRRGAEPWFRLVMDAIERGQREGRMRAELDPEIAVAQMGTLIVTTFALMPISAWSERSPRVWRERRLAGAVRALEHMLYPDARAPAAPRRKVRPGPGRER
jgi:TetR/AcrR family transcriptional regulator